MTRKAVTGRKKADLVIMFNGNRTSLEQVLLSTAQKKAHHMVRDYLMKDFRKKEAVARIELENECISQVYGFRKCALASINIVHL